MTKTTRFTLLALVLIVLVAAASISILAGCNKPAPTGSAATTAGATYTCPMHPEVTSPKPGTCPKCKMDLAKKGS